VIKKSILILLIISFGLSAGFFIFKSEPQLNKNFENEKTALKKFPFRLGLDLSGGSHLVYQADVSALKLSEVSSSMDALRDVIERRINLFGVSEPVVQIQEDNFISKGGQKLIVDLPGVTDVEKATIMIGQTPFLEFRIEKPTVISENKNKEAETKERSIEFLSTQLTGRYLKKAILEFDSNTRSPVIKLQFNEEGGKLFAQITKDSIGKILAIYLDGSPISLPVVREEITGGEAVISGEFTPKEAKILVGRLNSGALPVPISLISKQTIGAILGDQAVKAGVKAAIIGFIFLAIFLIFWYRLPGLIAVLALSIFVVIMLTLFKLIPVTLTAAGIAGFVISVGIAVDANVLIFERIKEELISGRKIKEAVSIGFSRAWYSIRDSNTSNIITALILFWFGTSLIKGFALTFGLGTLVSMFSAITVTRIFLSVFDFVGNNKFTRVLFLSGFKFKS
jgi:protein-export membrane protein SecD